MIRPIALELLAELRRNVVNNFFGAM